MVYGCCNRTVKVLFFTSNLLICLLGTIIFAVSLLANLDENFAHKINETNGLHQYHASLWIMVTIGAFLFLVGFLGCCGAIFENITMLTLFFIIVLVTTVVEVVAVIYVITTKDELKTLLYESLTEVGSAEDEELQKLKPLQFSFDCCGATRETMNRYIENNLCEEELRNKTDCFTAIADHFESSGRLLMMCFGVLLIIESLALIATCIQCKAFYNQRPIYYA
ncbi:unnamed protein product [Cercopithifilaria johnstoni]|uniref:Tetraspanin n=1 Tax=Cercopithifilaria johnstoni TaxID=2874296 RepID=A0A8J2M1R7_9BILA|nr:unnamed protein product [Cercopithifilaria johnstoni]